MPGTPYSRYFRAAICLWSVTIHGLGAAHSNDSGRYGKSASQNRPSLLNHILTERAVYAQWGRPCAFLTREK